jgi:putative salt-induced outer membrane protein YdiY
MRAHAIIPVCLLCALGLAGAARADRVTVKGVALEGKVLSLSAKTVEMETVYGKGTLTLDLADVEALETEGRFHVFHGDGAETVGRLVGVREGSVLVGESAADAEAVPASSIDVAHDAPPDPTLIDDVQVALPYWTGSFDLGFNFARENVDTTSLATGLALKRSHDADRLSFSTTFRRGTREEDGEDEEKTADELRGVLRAEHDLTPRLFVFGSAEGEHDGIERLSFRGVPKAGLGYFLIRNDTLQVSVDGGPAYVYERFFGGDVEDYFAAALGGGSEWKLPFAGAVWTTRWDYLPSVTDWADDYLLRGETALLVPIVEGLSFKASLVDTYDSLPAEGSESNSLAGLLGLALGF